MTTTTTTTTPVLNSAQIIAINKTAAKHLQDNKDKLNAFNIISHVSQKLHYGAHEILLTPHGQSDYYVITFSGGPAKVVSSFDLNDLNWIRTQECVCGITTTFPKTSPNNGMDLFVQVGYAAAAAKTQVNRAAKSMAWKENIVANKSLIITPDNRDGTSSTVNELVERLVYGEKNPDPVTVDTTERDGLLTIIISPLTKLDIWNATHNITDSGCSVSEAQVICSKDGLGQLTLKTLTKTAKKRPRDTDDVTTAEEADVTKGSEKRRKFLPSPISALKRFIFGFMPKKQNKLSA